MNLDNLSQANDLNAKRNSLLNLISKMDIVPNWANRVAMGEGTMYEINLGVEFTKLTKEFITNLLKDKLSEVEKEINEFIV
jgi:hypothetical protein